MKDKDMAVPDLVRTFSKLGRDARVGGSYLVLVQNRPDGARRARQHLHKGTRDILRRAKVRRLYRHFGFTPEQFYAAAE